MKRELRSEMFLGSTIEEIKQQLNLFLIENHICPGNHVDFELCKLGNVYQFIYFYATVVVAEDKPQESKPFVYRCADGEARLQDIDDEVAKWHSSPKTMNDPLYVFLGMTWGEYCRWVHNPNSLASIVKKYEDKRERS